jgi:hypothetical protein
MTSVDGILRLLHSKLALEISQNFEVTIDTTPSRAEPDTVLPSPQAASAPPTPASQSLAGLAPPLAGFASMDVDAVAGLLQNAMSSDAVKLAAWIDDIRFLSSGAESGLTGAQQADLGREVLRQMISRSISPTLFDPAAESIQAPATSSTAVRQTLASAGDELQLLEHPAASSNSQGSGLNALVPSGLPSERTGIIASAILNAAVIPGWPPPRPIESEAAAQLTPVPKMSDEEMLTYIANLGANPMLIEKARKMLANRRNGKKILFYLAILMTALSVVIDRLANEFSALTDEESEVRENLDASDPFGHNGRRRRLYLE